MKVLSERLDLIRREIDKLKAQESLLLDMIRDASGQPKVKLRAPRSNVKQTILELLENVGEAGLNAATAVETAAKAGITLERGTVSSLLSRLKNEGVVVYDGSVYRLMKFKPGSGPNVHPLRTSGAQP
jgi:DNA-binding transcriptional ArsR family regulator